MTNEGGGIYSPDHWDPCPCWFCAGKKLNLIEGKPMIYIGKVQLEFLEKTKGKEAALALAKQTMAVYKTAILTSRKRGFASPHFGSLPEYRRSFISFYLHLKQYVGQQERNSTHE